MSRPIVTLLTGPELYWTAVWLVAQLLASRNQPSTPDGNAFLESLWWLLPLVTVPLSYVVWLSPYNNGVRWWLVLLRINIAAIAGLSFSLIAISNAVDYHDSRNSGVFAGFAIGLGVGLLLLGTCDVAALVRLWITRRPAP